MLGNITERYMVVSFPRSAAQGVEIRSAPLIYAADVARAINAIGGDMCAAVMPDVTLPPPPIVGQAIAQLEKAKRPRPRKRAKAKK